MTRFLPHALLFGILALAVDLIRRLTPPAPDKLHFQPWADIDRIQREAARIPLPAKSRLTGYHTSTDRELRNGRDVADTDEWGHAGGESLEETTETLKREVARANEIRGRIFRGLE